ncbi:MAG: phosphatase PAP2 family protein [Acidobacteriota bacterium]|nr:phosphatase PAP2 family protein [Acidobacteriota bacterium]MDQ5872676.1 phosphatase PAP2 family protein [Acidobacteriota bacterium]
MKTLFRAALAVALFSSSFAARADVVTEWNSAALDAIRVARTAPPPAARILAILHVSIYDAVNGIHRTHEPYFVRDKAPGAASIEAAASAAARRVLVSLYPAQAGTFNALYDSQVAGIRAGPPLKFGIAWGEAVATAILAWRAGDHSSDIVPYTPGSGTGAWVPTAPAFAAALLPQWPGVTPFAMDSPSQFRPPAPPALDSQEWADEYNQTKEVGSATSATRTLQETEIARFWADGAGTVTPPGHWNVIAQDVSGQQGLTLEQNARLFALLNIAEADAAILSWDCKYAFNFWRPITAIRNGDLDSRTDTEKEAGWTPLLVTPPFPEYTSGHSTFSAAGATILAAFFGRDDVAFTTFSEDLPGVSRNFSSFSEAALEAGMSSIFGGIHFLSANRAGLFSGGQLGAFVAENFLKDRPGRSQRGH